jgi:hypothetical protein
MRGAADGCNRLLQKELDRAEAEAALERKVAEELSRLLGQIS